MDKKYNVGYNIHKIKKEEVVKMVAIPKPKEVGKITTLKEQKSNTINKGKKSAIDISESVGVYGAFNRTLSDLHRQGK